MERNRARGKFEPEDFVRKRHALSSSLRFDRAPVRVIDTDRSPEATLLDIKQAIWETL